MYLYNLIVTYQLVGGFHMKKITKKSKGFTLIELLIVMIIIGVLAGMMTLSTGGSTDKAKATKLVNDMRVLKSACLLYSMENEGLDSLFSSSSSSIEGEKLKPLYAYTDIPDSIINDMNFSLWHKSGGYFIAYPSDKLSKPVKTALQKMAESNHLLGTGDVDAALYDPTSKFVNMLVIRDANTK